MATVLPLICKDHFYSVRPSRIINQRFGVGLDLDDLFSPINFQMARCPAGYYRPCHSAVARGDAGSTISVDKNNFHVTLDVQQYTPEEITVKVTNSNTITVEGKHEEREDDHGFVSRHFTRRYVLPDGHDINKVVSSLSSDGVLHITAPSAEQLKEEHRSIAIQHPEGPSEPLGNEKEENQISKQG